MSGADYRIERHEALLEAEVEVERLRDRLDSVLRAGNRLADVAADCAEPYADDPERDIALAAALERWRAAT